MMEWLTQRSTDLPASLAWLAPDERARADAMLVPKRRADFLLGRWTAKQLIARVLPQHPPLASLAVRPASDGAPEPFAGEQPLPLAISISHSAGRALAVVHPSDVGADLERLEPRDPRLAEDFFAADEAAAVARSPDRDLAITVLWSCKEAALKALRRGLRDDPRDVRIALGETRADGWQCISIAAPGAAPFAGWWRLDDGYVIAIAVRSDRCASPAVASYMR